MFRKTKLSARDGLTVDEDDVNPVRAREKKVESMFPWILILVVLGVIAFVYFLVSYLSTSTKVTVENPTAHTYYAAFYCAKIDSNDSNKGAESPMYTRYRKGAAIAHLESEAVKIAGGYLDGSEDCYLVYGQHRNMPRKVILEELKLWADPAYRDADTPPKWISAKIARDQTKISIVV
eukprot:TRINITY_DN9118_c0_g2_i1.p2 TRINITY_DN9118_c0_g2~~TRINITY_DN9118_c0_g2_i1.p2  ORF type:complete len:178 (-),score=31.59 TRINITY_DN9118_c0_g2_i1:210-743(-)